MSDKSNRRTSDGSKKKAWISIIAFIVLLAIILAVLLITLTKCDKDNVGDNVNGGNSDNIGGGGSDIVPGGDGDGQGGGNVDTPCTHNIVIDQAVPAGCLTTGLTEGKHCSLCNAVIVEQTEIPALGHSAIVDPEVPADCLNAGLTAGSHCGVCGEVITAQTEISALGHNPVDDPEVPADCLNAGLTAGSHCGVCGTKIVEQTEIPALGHEYSWVDNGDGTCTGTCANDATHVETGNHIDDIADEICDNCGANMHVHQWGQWTDNGDGTCTRVCSLDDSHVETGNHIDDIADEICDNCGANMHVHDWSQWTDNGDGTCTRVCSLDDSHVETGNHIDDIADEICDNCGANMHVHQWGEWTFNPDGTTHTRVCLLDDSHTETGDHTGMEDCTCDVCGGVNHVTHDNNMTRCDKCGTTFYGYDFNVGDKVMIDHRESGSNTMFDASYDNYGQIINTLSSEFSLDPNRYLLTVEAGAVDGSFALKTPFGKYVAMDDEYQLVYIDEINEYSSWTHSGGWAVMSNVKDPNTSFGSSYEYDQYVIHVGSEPVAPKRVILVIVCIYNYSNVNVGHEVTYKDNGDGTHTISCSICGDISTDEACYGGTATCTDKATCTGCGAGYGEATHTNIVTDNEVPATCTTTGLTAGSHCEDCKEVIVAQTEIPALGHNPVDDPEVPADCLNAGLTAGSHCSVCGTIIDEQDEIPALGHEYSWVDNGDGTCTGTCAKDSSHVETADHIDDNADKICDNCGANMHVHDWGQWTDNGDGTCTRVCSLDDSHIETGDHTGMEEDCTCDNCGAVNHVTHDSNVWECDVCHEPTAMLGEPQIGDKVMIEYYNSPLEIKPVFDASNGTIIGNSVFFDGQIVDPNKYLLTLEQGSQEGTFAFKLPFGDYYLSVNDDRSFTYSEVIDDASSWELRPAGSGVHTINNVKLATDLIYEDGFYIRGSRIILYPFNIQIMNNVNVGHEVIYTDNGDGTHTITCSVCGVISTDEACYGGTATCTEKATCAGCGAGYGEASHVGMETDCTCDDCGYVNHTDTDGNIFDCEVCGGTIPFKYIDTNNLVDDSNSAPMTDDKGVLQDGDKILIGHRSNSGEFMEFKTEENLGYKVNLGNDTTGMDNPEQYLLEVVKVGENMYRFKTHFGKYLAMDENKALVYSDEINDYSTWTLKSTGSGDDKYLDFVARMYNVGTGTQLSFPERAVQRGVSKASGLCIYIFRDVNKE